MVLARADENSMPVPTGARSTVDAAPLAHTMSLGAAEARIVECPLTLLSRSTSMSTRRVIVTLSSTPLVLSWMGAPMTPVRFSTPPQAAAITAMMSPA